MTSPAQPASDSTIGAPKDLLLCVGEALIDIVRRPDGAPDIELPGGSLLNVACGLARLGESTALASWWGGDARGRLLAATAEAAGVQVLPGVAAAAATATALAELDADGHASYSFELEWRLPPVGDLDAVQHLHTGSIAATLEPGGTQVIDLIRRLRGDASISYDPNVRPALMGSPAAVLARVEDVVATADVVKVSDEDLAWLYPGQDLEAIAPRWLASGPAMVVVTRGGAGASVWLTHESGPVTVAAPRVHVGDTVGAGDSFMAGLLSGLRCLDLLGSRAAIERLRAASWSQVEPAIRRALATSAITVTHQGAYAPTLDEVHLDQDTPAPRG